MASVRQTLKLVTKDSYTFVVDEQFIRESNILQMIALSQNGSTVPIVLDSTALKNSIILAQLLYDNECSNDKQPVLQFLQNLPGSQLQDLSIAADYLQAECLRYYVRKVISMMIQEDDINLMLVTKDSYTFVVDEQFIRESNVLQMIALSQNGSTVPVVLESTALKNSIILAQLLYDNECSNDKHPVFQFLQNLQGTQLQDLSIATDYLQAECLRYYVRKVISMMIQEDDINLMIGNLQKCHI
uniref:Mic1 domain-containing protein n=1 Tax=Panagrellus redivivus TaxID=6233 RepID=A0A7E4V5H1_PANRE